MSNLRIFTKTILSLILLFSFSCSYNEQKETVKVSANQQDNAEEIKEKQGNQQNDNEEVKETKVEVISGENNELTTKDLTQNRDLNQYDQGGHFDCRGLIAKNESRVQCNENKIRDFIWQHWTKKKRGYIRVTYNSVDATSTSHIFIEPNEKSEWQITWKIARLHAMPKYNSLLTDILGITSVERIKDEPEKGKWALMFKNKSGSIVQTFPHFYIEK